MTRIAAITGLLTVVMMVMAAIKTEVHSGSEKVQVPNPNALGILYATIERGDRIHEFYGNRIAIDAAKANLPLPSGSVITVVETATMFAPQADPARDADRPRVRAYISGYLVMEKRDGWGTDYPPEKRNGEWEFERFDASSRKMSRASDLEHCFACHKRQTQQDFVFTIDRMKSAK